MKVTLATISDLKEIQKMYTEIVKDMHEIGITIWNEVYPNTVFESDIENEVLYIIRNDTNEIIAGFALNNSNIGEDFVEWADKEVKVLYLDRFGINVKYKRQGLAKTTLEFAEKIAIEKGAKYLRLFVVDSNTAAIDTYLKYGYDRVDGVFEDNVHTGVLLYEYGYEKEIC